MLSNNIEPTTIWYHLMRPVAISDVTIGPAKESKTASIITIRVNKAACGGTSTNQTLSRKLISSNTGIEIISSRKYENFELLYSRLHVAAKSLAAYVLVSCGLTAD